MLAGIFGVVILFVTIIAIKSRDAHNSIGKSEVIPSADSSRKADVPKIEINAISDTSFCKIEGKDGEAWWLQGDFKKISINHQGNFEDQKRHNYEYPSFSVDRNDINKLIAALSKSLEWSKIAKTNDVEPFNKVITPFDEHEEAIFIHANEEDSIYFHYRIGANVEWAKNLNQEKSSLDAQFTCSDVEKLLGLFSQIPEMDKALIVKNNKAAKDAEKFK